MKARELREMSDEELQLRLNELKEEIFNLRVDKAMGKLGQPHRFKMAKREIARILVILRERELEKERGGEG